jgi:hypothetical protein
MLAQYITAGYKIASSYIGFAGFSVYAHGMTMKIRLIHTGAALLTCTIMFFGHCAYSQTPDSSYVVIKAGPEYKRSSIHNFFWGKHYRKEWNTPVRMPLMMLDTAAGGLTPYEGGGSRQTKSLRLHDRNGREYVLRSIDKTFGGALPENLRGTFIENIINDQVSVAHPYSAVMVAPMAEAARIYHTWPTNLYLPKQNALDTFNSSYANTLYVLEQRPDENWETAPNFGNAKKIISTDKLFEKLHEDNKNTVDQEEFVRARLFDMFIGDWGRHEDQWRWAEFENDSSTRYKPIPRDRDQAFTKFDGLLVKFAQSVSGLGHQQSFGPTINNIKTYNFAARNLDRVMTTMVTKQQWVNIAKELQRILTDDVISYSIHRMPPEVFRISGEKFIRDLRSRRSHLVEFAEGYYNFLAKEVDITASEKNEYIEISDDPKGDVSLVIYDLDKEGNKKRVSFRRVFTSNETHEIRVYGWSGKDVYDVNLSGTSRINVRLIGGIEDDEYKINSKGKLHIYDGNDEKIPVNGKADLNLSKDSAIHEYRYESFKYNKIGLSPSLYYSKQHVMYVGLAYSNLKYKWRKYPYASLHEMYVHYSPTQNALRTGYAGAVYKFIDNWNLILNANYDWVSVINFFGVGNETQRLSGSADFYRIRSESGYLTAGLSHNIGMQGNVTFSPFLQTVKLLNDADRFLIKDFLGGIADEDYFKTKKFAGISASLKMQQLDDQVVPMKGYRFTAAASYTKNIQSPADFVSTAGDLHFYFPLSRKFVLVIKNGLANVSGNPEFYQLSSIGGRRLRGYRRERFWGNTAYYNNNELQYLFNFKNVVLSGKAGLMLFADQGRVWLDKERSDVWHYGYGGGIILAPFSKIYVAVMYGTSPENKSIFHLDLRRTIK